jgi:predicted O-methyltransferase YrrM
MQTYAKRIDLIKALPAGAVLAEIGVWKGYFSIEMLNHSRIGKLFLVDAWKPQPSYNDPLTDTDHEANLSECKHHIRGHLASGRVVIVRGTSVEVAANDRTIPPLDAVYIDADHSYEACGADLVAWSKRLKPDGVILGHDYTENEQAKKWNFGVIPAVRDFCANYGWKLTALTTEDFASYRLERVK